jgi:two-component system, NarL family, response regulator NreC
VNKTTIAIADDHPMVRKAVLDTLGKENWIQSIGAVADGHELMALLKTTVPDVVLIDLKMPGMNGYDLIPAITAQYPEVRILVFSGFLTLFSQQRVKTLGAHATVCKSESGQTIVRAVKEVVHGNSFHSKVFDINRDMAVGKDDNGLTRRQNQILDMIGQGKTTREISQYLGISPWTVDKHRSNIKEKLGLRTLAEMIRYAIENNEDDR